MDSDIYANASEATTYSFHQANETETNASNFTNQASETNPSAFSTNQLNVTEPSTYFTKGTTWQLEDSTTVFQEDEKTTVLAGSTDYVSDVTSDLNFTYDATTLADQTPDSDFTTSPWFPPWDQTTEPPDDGNWWDWVVDNWVIVAASAGGLLLLILLLIICCCCCRRRKRKKKEAEAAAAASAARDAQEWPSKQNGQAVEQTASSEDESEENIALTTRTPTSVDRMTSFQIRFQNELDTRYEESAAEEEGYTTSTFQVPNDPRGRASTASGGSGRNFVDFSVLYHNKNPVNVTAVATTETAVQTTATSTNADDISSSSSEPPKTRIVMCNAYAQTANPYAYANRAYSDSDQDRDDPSPPPQSTTPNPSYPAARTFQGSGYAPPSQNQKRAKVPPVPPPKKSPPPQQNIPSETPTDDTNAYPYGIHFINRPRPTPKTTESVKTSDPNKPTGAKPVYPAEHNPNQHTPTTGPTAPYRAADNQHSSVPSTRYPGSAGYSSAQQNRTKPQDDMYLHMPSEPVSDPEQVVRDMGVKAYAKSYPARLHDDGQQNRPISKTRSALDFDSFETMDRNSANLDDLNYQYKRWRRNSQRIKKMKDKDRPVREKEYKPYKASNQDLPPPPPPPPQQQQQQQQQQEATNQSSKPPGKQYHSTAPNHYSSKQRAEPQPYHTKAWPSDKDAPSSRTTSGQTSPTSPPPQATWSSGQSYPSSHPTDKTGRTSHKVYHSSQPAGKVNYNLAQPNIYPPPESKTAAYTGKPGSKQTSSTNPYQNRSSQNVQPRQSHPPSYASAQSNNWYPTAQSAGGPTDTSQRYSSMGSNKHFYSPGLSAQVDSVYRGAGVHLTDGDVLEGNEIFM